MTGGGGGGGGGGHQPTHPANSKEMLHITRVEEQQYIYSTTKALTQPVLS